MLALAQKNLSTIYQLLDNVKTLEKDLGKHKFTGTKKIYIRCSRSFKM